MLLLLTSEDYQIPADWLAAECERRSVPHLRLYSEQLPAEVVVTIRPLGGRPHGAIRVSDQEVAIEAITGVWHYLPGPGSVDPGLDEVARLLIQQEARETLQGLAGALADRRWINLPFRVRAAQHKLFQLQLAAQVGFKTPKSLVTNQPAQAARFLQACGGQMVYKPQHTFLQLDAEGSLAGGVFVSLVEERQLAAYLDSIAIAPCLFQEVVPKAQEVTAYVIGSYVFAAAVHSPAAADGDVVDHRVYGLENCRYTPIHLPPAIEDMCLAMTRQLGLGMCNIDLIYTPDGEYVFLDANPTEQWTFFEHTTGFPIGAAIVDELLGVTTVAEHPYLRERALTFTRRVA